MEVTPSVFDLWAPSSFSLHVLKPVSAVQPLSRSPRWGAGAQPSPQRAPPFAPPPVAPRNHCPASQHGSTVFSKVSCGGILRPVPTKTSFLHQACGLGDLGHFGCMFPLLVGAPCVEASVLVHAFSCQWTICFLPVIGNEQWGLNTWVQVCVCTFKFSLAGNFRSGVAGWRGKDVLNSIKLPDHVPAWRDPSHSHCRLWGSRFLCIVTRSWVGPWFLSVFSHFNRFAEVLLTGISPASLWCWASFSGNMPSLYLPWWGLH